jgi:hypothetical protein
MHNAGNDDHSTQAVFYLRHNIFGCERREEWQSNLQVMSFVIHNLHSILKVKYQGCSDGGEHVHWGMRNAYKIEVWKHEQKKQLGTPQQG